MQPLRVICFTEYVSNLANDAPLSVILHRMATQAAAATPAPSRRIAAEIRAELARQGISNRRLAVTMGVSYQWVNRRVGMHADVDLTFEEVDRIAAAIGVPTGRLVVSSGWLPRLDSNQQPFGYRPSRVPQQRTPPAAA
jgi:hypothetical protein